MMLSRLTRRLVPTMVASATTKRDRERLRQALRLQREEEVEAVVLGREDPGGERHEHGAEPDPRCDSEGGCHRGVDPAFGRERADELGAAHADRTGHPELRLALGGEHDEEVHEQQQAGEHPEAPHRGEHRREPLPHRLGHIERRPLDRVDLRIEPLPRRQRHGSAR